MIFTNILVKYLTLQDDQTEYDDLIYENQPKQLTIGTDKSQVTYDVIFNEITLTQQPKKVIQLQFQSQEQMQAINTINFMAKGLDYNDAEIIRKQDKNQIIAYIKEVSLDQITEYTLQLVKSDNVESEIQIDVMAIQDVVMEERRRLVVGRQNFYGYYQPAITSNVTLQLSSIEKATEISIYMSQDNFIPTEEDIKICQESVPASKVISKVISSTELDFQKPIYISIVTNNEQTSYVVQIAPEGYLIEELLEDQTTSILMNNGQTKDFIFQPYWSTYNFKTVSSDKTMVQVEMKNEMLQKLIENEVDIYGHVSRLTNPNTRSVSHTFSFKQHAIIGDDNKAYIKHNEFVNTPQESNLFITFTCDGEKCQDIDLVEFNVTINTMNEITQWKPSQVQYIQFRDDGKAQNFYIDTEQYMQTKLDILVPENKNRVETVKCSDIKYKAIACIGTYPDQLIRENLASIENCYEFEFDEEENKLPIQINTDSERYASGKIYVRIEPDYSQIQQDLQQQVSQCYQQVNLYNNRKIDTYGEQITYYLASGYGEAKALHLVADVPVISQKAAKTNEDGTKQYGDRLVIEYKSDQPVYICMSDKLDNYYPYYTEKQNTCTLYHNDNAVNRLSKVITFDNYKNQDLMGGRANTRVYISIWTNEKVENGKLVQLNFTIAPQLYISYDQKINEVGFMSHYQNGLEKYISFAIDIEGKKDQVINGSIIVGPAVDNDHYRQDVPEAFYQQNIITYAGVDTLLPNKNQYNVKTVEKGLQVISISNVTRGQFRDCDTIYIQIYYRRHEELKYNPKGRSALGYTLYYVSDFNQNSQIGYQSGKSIQLTEEDQEQQHFYVNNPYVPSELVIQPCKGTQYLYVDAMSYNNTQSVTPVSPVKPGRLSYYIFNDNDTRNMNQFLTVQSSKQSEYNIVFGNQAQLSTPGNKGQIVIEEFDSANNKLKIRIAPARTSMQTSEVSEVNYFIYIVPYQREFDPVNDYSPFTKCGVDKIGYSVYKNEQDLDVVTVDSNQVQKDGYVTIEANQNLFQQGAKLGDQLYVQVFADQVPYEGALLGTQTVQATQSITIITSCVAVGMVILAVLSFVLYKKYQINKKQEQVISL